MRVAVVGLGGVGGYIAASLVRAEVEVVGFARGAHLEEIQSNGLTIVEDKETWNVKIDTREEDDLDGFFDGYFDFVLFCVKSYDLVQAYNHLRSHIDTHTTLISFSNGVNNGDTLRELSDAIVLDGCVYILSHIDIPGMIRKKGSVFAAVFGGDAKSTLALKSLFEKANLRVKTPEDIQTALWKKYIFISAFANLTTYYDAPIGAIYEHYFDDAKTLLHEIASVAKAKGIEIEEEIEKSLQTASKVPYDASTSMYLDFKNKKRDELESLSGYIVKEAKRFSLQTPLMQKIYNKLLTRHRD